MRRMDLLHALLLILGACTLLQASKKPKFNRGKFFRDMQRNKVPEPKLDKSKFSSGTESTCRDISYNCRYYESYCRSNNDVASFCLETCGLCFENKAPTVDKNCKDQHPQCAALVQNRYCRGTVSQRRFVSYRCRASCKICVLPTKTTGKSWPSLTSCGEAPAQRRQSNDIVNGKPVKKGSYPWQAAVIFEGEFLCGASVIDKQYLLSAAHCYSGIETEVSEFKVVLGEHNQEYPEGSEKYFDVEKIVVHNGYIGGKHDEDIALIKLSRPTEYTDYIQPICLPPENKELRAETVCQISGWGKMYHIGQTVNILQEIAVPVVDHDKCTRRNNRGPRVVTKKMICTGFNDGYSFQSACHGDSGGPMQCGKDGKWTLYGVVSWGSPVCNGLDTYNVFTKVSKYRKWISDTYYNSMQ